jgi:hypothetical protein
MSTASTLDELDDDELDDELDDDELCLVDSTIA